MRVVIVDEELPYPLITGKRIRVFNLLRHLAQQHDVTLIAHRNRDVAEVEPAVDALRNSGIDSVVVEPAGPARLAHAGRWLTPLKLVANSLSRAPYSVQWHRCPNLQRALRSHDREHRVDLWQCEWAPYAANILAAGVGPWVMMAHDIQTSIWQRHARTERQPLKRRLIEAQVARYRAYERRIFSQAELVITVTQSDAALAESQFAARRTETVENGVDVRGYQAGNPGASPARDRAQVLFVANLEWRPNADAARILVAEVFPRVRSAQPRATLVLVGRRPPSWLKRQCAETPGVTLHADVADVRPFYRQAGMLAVPLRFASGSRLKILEALVTGTPVVSSTVGAEGLRLTAGVHYAFADEPAVMAQAIIDWIARPELADAAASAGRQVVEQQYDWSQLAQRMHDAWTSLDRHAERQASPAPLVPLT